ncbi:hypothetical protein CBS14141_002477 [Malassezia furfur]|nr:hypothetical protein CBS14141_002477 [Malassezia furfur]
MSKRAISSNDVLQREHEGRGLARTSSEYASIPPEIQAQLQSMSWRIRANVNRGYAGGPRASELGAPRHFTNAQNTLQEVKSSFHQWGRTATMPTGALRGTAMPPPSSQDANMFSQWSSDTESANTSLNVIAPKRGLDDDDADNILANAFDDDDSFWPASHTNIENRPLDTGRTMRPLPSRGPFQATKSMPPLRESPSAFGMYNLPGASSDDEPMRMSDDPFPDVDISAYTTRTDNF